MVENDGSTTPSRRHGSFQGTSNFENSSLSNTAAAPIYACIGTDGVAFLLQISNLHVDMTRLTGMDSEIIGIYSNESM